MPCYRPLDCYRSMEKTKNGKRAITFDRKQALHDVKIRVPCGQCIGCRLERSRQWAMRCVHEASMHEDNCFITLTYSDEHLPEDGSLSVREFQLFMKKLRKAYGSGIRFFHCGEYGDENRRPHYHACLFNHDFHDKQLWKVKNGQRLYISESLEKLWGLGFCTVGDVTFESAAYVARYIMKKVTGELADDHYTVFDPETGEITAILQPEYVTMSRRPGIGKAWYDKWKKDAYPSDFIMMRGVKMRPPKFYDHQLEQETMDELRKIKRNRKRATHAHKADNTDRRLKVREQVKNAQIARLPRNEV